MDVATWTLTAVLLTCPVIDGNVPCKTQETVTYYYSAKEYCEQVRINLASNNNRIVDSRCMGNDGANINAVDTNKEVIASPPPEQKEDAVISK